MPRVNSTDGWHAAPKEQARMNAAYAENAWQATQPRGWSWGAQEIVHRQCKVMDHLFAIT
jgi:hypothetical protein